MKSNNHFGKDCLRHKLCKILLLVSISAFSQLPSNMNTVANFHSPPSGGGSLTRGWVLDMKLLSSGDVVTVGYTANNTYAAIYPTITKRVGGTLIYEQVLTCISGMYLNMFDTPAGYVVFGTGNEVGSCSPHNGYFSVLLDKSTGLPISNWSIKFYDGATISSSPKTLAGGLATFDRLTNDIPSFCEIKNTAGSITGYMICGNYSAGYMSTLQNYSDGSFLLMTDVLGNVDCSFGNNGLVYFHQTGAGSTKYLNSHVNAVAVDYNTAGKPQGFVACGFLNENPLTAPAYSEDNIDAFIIKTNLTGNILWEDIYDDNVHRKNGLAYGIPYLDNPDFGSCANTNLLTKPQENNNEMAIRLVQDRATGDFLVLNRFDYVYGYLYSGCPSSYPTSGLLTFADPTLLRIQSNNTVIWSQNLFQSSGVDYENDLELLPNGSEVLVLGCTTTNNLIFQEAVVSKVDINTSAILYERVYASSASGQTMICPFTLSSDGVLGSIGGDADGTSINWDYYESYIFQY